MREDAGASYCLLDGFTERGYTQLAGVRTDVSVWVIAITSLTCGRLLVRAAGSSGSEKLR